MDMTGYMQGDSMKKTGLMFFSLLLLARPLPALAEGLVLKFHETQKITTNSPAKYQLPGKNFQFVTAHSEAANDYTVTLQPTVLDVRHGDTEDIYDFAAKRLLQINHAKKIYFSRPLQAVPLYRHNQKDFMGGRAFNFENMTKSGKFIVTPQGYTLDVNSIHIDLDTLYASNGDTSTSDIVKSETNGNKTTLSSSYGALAAFTLSDTAVPEDLKKTYAHFLMYAPLLHPVAETAMNDGGKVFATLDYTIKDHMGKEINSSWVFNGASPAAEMPKAPADYTLAYSDDADVNASFATSLQPGPTALNYADKIKAFVAQGDTLRATLALSEMVAALPKAESDTQKALTDTVLRATNDIDTQKVLLAVSHTQTTKEDISGADDTLKAAKKRAPDYGYFIDLYRARNIRSELTNPAIGAHPDEARFALSILMDSNAVTVNPWLATAYADLGDANFDGGDGLFAWTAWENAARLKPDLNTVQKMTQLKARAEKDYPEYF